MKKSLLTIATIAAFLVGCTKSEQPSYKEDPTPEDSNYVLMVEDMASSQELTKTLTDAEFNVSWQAGDAVAVYTWPTGTALPTEAAEWRNVEPVLFSTADAGGSPRKFTLCEEQEEESLAETDYSLRLDAFKARFAASDKLDWGVMYPGKMANGSRPGMGIIVFGDEQRVNCTQKGNDNMEHLADQDVLYGYVSGTKTPTVKLRHIGTMMEYDVHNTFSEPIVVEYIKIKATSALVGGQFRFNVFEGRIDSDMTQLHECPLYVEDAEAIPVDGTARFYQILAPFTLEEGKTAEIVVKTDKGIFTKVITAESSMMTFASGARNTVALNVNFGSDRSLVQHDAALFEFGSGNLGCYYDLENGVMKTYPCAAEDQPAIDLVVFRGSGKKALVLAAPSDADLQEYIDNSIKGWSQINATSFKIVDIDFDATTTLSEITAAYESSDAAAGCRATVKKGSVVVAKTVEGNYALIKVVDTLMYGELYGGFTLSFKTVE